MALLACGAGFVFLAGHDPDFHALAGGGTTGGINISRRAISNVMDPAHNTYVAGGATKFLFVESRIPVPSGHVNGIIASGYTRGVDFHHTDASGLNAALDPIGTTYGALVVAWDFGGILTQAELDILNTRAADIAHFVNTNGRIYAWRRATTAAT